MSDFHKDRTIGNAAEQILVDLLSIHGIPAHLNPTPDPDDAPDAETRQRWYEGRAAFDIEVAGEYWEVKSDWASFRWNNICIEAESLRHTKATTFAYLIPNASGIYFHCFLTSELVTLYNAQIDVPRGDGTTYRQYRYSHKIVGTQATNEAVLLPKSITETVGKSLWQEIKTLKVHV